MARLATTRFSVKAHENKTISWWHSRRFKIDMNPSYQRRGKLWSRTDKAYLIDSILNGFDIPKLYLADFTIGDSPLNEERLSYAIIDGKQRFEALFEFLDNQYGLNEDFIYLEDPQIKLAGLSYKDLQSNHPDIAQELDNFNLSVVSVYAHDDGPIKELFVRLNRSKPLTGAELRNAMSGPTPDVIREISEHRFFPENTRIAGHRGEHLNAAAKLLMFEYYGDVCETKKKNLDGFVSNTEKEKPVTLELAGRRCLETLDDMASIFLPSDKLLGSSGVLPVYYWLIRNLDVAEYHFVREFLVQFEAERRANRENLKKDPQGPAVDDQLTEYDNFNRSTNDLRSHRGRLRILHTRLRSWASWLE